MTAVAYVAWLGWDQRYDRGPDGGLSGPYEVWQVAGLVLTAGILAGAAGWGRRAVVAILVMPTTLTLCFSVDAATDAENDGLWPIGATLVLIGTLAGVALVALSAEALATRAGTHQDSIASRDSRR